MTKTYLLRREQTLEQPLDEVFAFFADARNLETLTPPWLRFQILTPGEIEMHCGATIQYALRVHGLPVHWTTTIAAWKPPYEFVDVQLRGPYVLWHHRHTFTPQGGSTRMVDEVNYALPFGPLGRALHRLFVRRDLEAIFDYRAAKIAQIFGPSAGETPDVSERNGAPFAVGRSS